MGLWGNGRIIAANYQCEDDPKRIAADQEERNEAYSHTRAHHTPRSGKAQTHVQPYGIQLVSTRVTTKPPEMRHAAILPSIASDGSGQW